MFNPHRKYLWPVLLIIAVFAYGLTRLMVLRFEAGDVYPPYSSLRSDPLGTRALYESLNTVAPGSAHRRFISFDRALLKPQTTLLICGLQPNIEVLHGPQWEELMDQLADKGGRLVIAFTDRADIRSTREGAEEDEDALPEDSVPEPEAKAGHKRHDEIWEGRVVLGVDLLTGSRRDTAQNLGLAFQHDIERLPAVIPWHGSQYLNLRDDQWRAIYFYDAMDRPVIAQRPWGRGTLVMAADSYLFSNEALRKERVTGLLTWLLVPTHRVQFDEYHLGIVRQPGIASLARKYRLEGVFMVLLLVTLLFVWRQSVVFVPSTPDGEPDREDDSTMDADSSQGLVNLIQRHIPAKTLLPTCFGAWQASPAARLVDAERIAQAQQLVKNQDQSTLDPVERYRRISQLLQQGKQL